MSEQHYAYRGTRLRQSLHPSPRSIAIISLFSERAPSKAPPFYTNTERYIDRHSPDDMERLKHAERLTSHMAKAAFTLTSPVMAERCHDMATGDIFRIYFSVVEKDNFRRLTAAFNHIPGDERMVDSPVDADSVYVEIAANALAIDPERLNRARHALLREVGNPKKLLQVHEPKLVEKDISDPLVLPQREQSNILFP